MIVNDTLIWHGELRFGGILNDHQSTTKMGFPTLRHLQMKVDHTGRLGTTHF